MVHIRTLVEAALRQSGDIYSWGAEASFSDPNPRRFDCSELVEWVCRFNGVEMVDGSYNQWPFCRDRGGAISIPQGIDTYGALLFRIGVNGNHVAISLGDGRTIEARSTLLGVNVFGANSRIWTSAARIPGVDYGPGAPAPVPGGNMQLDAEAQQQFKMLVAAAILEMFDGPGDGPQKLRDRVRHICDNAITETLGQKFVDAARATK